MSNRDIPKFFTNPILGLYPYLVYLLLYHTTHKVNDALIISLVVAGLSEISIRSYTKTKACGIMFRVTFATAFITLIVWLFFRNKDLSDHVFSIIFEITLVCILILMGLFKSYITRHMYSKQNVLQKMFMNDFFGSARIVQHVLTLHIFFLFIFQYFSRETISSESDLYFIWLPFSFVVAMIVAHTLKMGLIISKLKKESWLPIVTEKGEVTGKIAKSVSLEMGNKFLHPIVRVALIYNDQIYLQDKSCDQKAMTAKLDHPFEQDILFKEEINLTVRNCIARIFNNEDVSFKFSLKYIFETPEIKRLVFLFIVKIDNEDQLNGMNLNGKFWTSPQIDLNMRHGVFSNCFEKEYEYLKNILLSPNRAI